MTTCITKHLPLISLKPLQMVLSEEKFCFNDNVMHNIIIIIIIGSLDIAPLSVPDGTSGALHKSTESKIHHSKNSKASDIDS